VIVSIDRDGKHYGTFRCSAAVNDWGEIDTEVWFCPHCGRIYARENIQFEEDEPHHRLVYRVLVRPCYMPLHDLKMPHPTLWLCADRDFLTSALKEHFNGTDSSNCPASSTATAA
jgi:hypothetical protein